ncbi:MAG: chitobiase/beta-hexosaminidase C-terminal domain-containing protein [Oscillospiraceae bacterium]|nr:chitobiase/beta-hexosaminidase C-terminal domain-containing protein [Oscillospiraceae bacterium]
MKRILSIILIIAMASSILIVFPVSAEEIPAPEGINVLFGSGSLFIEDWEPIPTVTVFSATEFDDLIQNEWGVFSNPPYISFQSDWFDVDRYDEDFFADKFLFFYHTYFRHGTQFEVTSVSVSVNSINVDITRTETFVGGSGYTRRLLVLEIDRELIDREISVEVISERRVSTPWISPNGGTFDGFVQVVLGAMPSNAAIFYTLDGTEPTRESAQFTEPFTLTRTTTVRAFAVLDGLDDSGIATAVFNIDLPQVETPTATPNGGTFTNSVNVALATETDGATIFYTLDGTTPTRDSLEYTAPFTLTATATVRAFAVMDGMADSEELSVTFTEQVETPTATPNGGTFTNSVNVALATETDGATIFYTLDGTTPTRNSLQYAAPFMLTATTTVRAIAVFDGKADSDVLNATFTRQTHDTGNNNPPPNSNWNRPPIITTPPPIDPQPPAGLPFVDVNRGDWFYNYVEYAFNNGLMNGVSATHFAPNAPTTRAMFVTVLWRLANSPNIGGESQFVDVASGTWYSQAVNWAAANGIVLGISETEFAPHVEITREQMAAIIYRSLNILLDEWFATQMYFIFEDADEISDFARNAIQTLANMGLMQGNADGTFNPQNTATRAEMAAVIMRLSER